MDATDGMPAVVCRKHKADPEAVQFIADMLEQ